MGYKVVIQFCYNDRWFQPGQEVVDIPFSEVENLIQQGVIREVPEKKQRR